MWPAQQNGRTAKAKAQEAGTGQSRNQRAAALCGTEKTKTNDRGDKASPAWQTRRKERGEKKRATTVRSDEAIIGREAAIVFVCAARRDCGPRCQVRMRGGLCRRPFLFLLSGPAAGLTSRIFFSVF